MRPAACSSAGRKLCELHHFLGRVERGEPSQVAPLADSVYALRIADAIVQSAAEKRIVTLQGDR
jgi:predicted dehydrogenase